MFTRIFTTITIFLLTSQIISAQKIFQQPKTISQVVGRVNCENKEWAYQNSPQYVWNTVFNCYIPSAYLSIRTQTPLNNPYKFFEINGGDYAGPHCFCRQEYKFEKYTKIHLRVRVGSLDYTNYLERKINAIKPQF